MVSEMLGHSSVMVTLDVYSHVIPTMQESAAEQIVQATCLDGGPSRAHGYSGGRPRYLPFGVRGCVLRG